MSEKNKHTNETSFNAETARLAGQKSGDVRRAKAAARAAMNEVLIKQVDDLFAEFKSGKLFGEELSADIKARMAENVATSVIIGRMQAAIKYQNDADLMALRVEYKAEENKPDREDDSRTGLTPTDIMKLVGTQSESLSSKVEETEEELEAELMNISFIEWYNDECDLDVSARLIADYFEGSQSDFFSVADAPALEVLKARGIPYGRD
ncbi:hypothetical protein [Aeromonas dhakensis]|uniref:hypothetical protein n=1 Tax=Aeromonas dhakensis TaxID=196024 RepID=UPI0038D08BB7